MDLTIVLPMCRLLNWRKSSCCLTATRMESSHFRSCNLSWSPWARDLQVFLKLYFISDSCTLNSDELLLENVREVSEDYIYDTLEFNEFLQMMAKQHENEHTRTDLKSAFRNWPPRSSSIIYLRDIMSYPYKHFRCDAGIRLTRLSPAKAYFDCKDGHGSWSLSLHTAPLNQLSWN